MDKPLAGKHLVVTGSATSPWVTQLRRAGAKVVVWRPLMDIDRAVISFRKRLGHLHGAVNLLPNPDLAKAQAFMMLETGGGVILNLGWDGPDEHASNGVAVIRIETIDGLVESIGSRPVAPAPAWHD